MGGASASRSPAHSPTSRGCCSPTSRTGNLDSKRSREILMLMRDICHERGIPGLLVTHDLDATQFVDRVHALRDGHLADGLDPELVATSS